MASTDLLRKTVAEFFEVDESEVGPAFPLDGRRAQGSVGRAALDAAIRRRVGLKTPAVYSARTFGELAGEPQAIATNGSAPTASAPIAAEAPRIAHSANGVSCGVDLELVENLPIADDPWEHPFYRTHFAPGEIAYCLLQDDPRPHFAARWCAKEALKKADPALFGAEFRDLEVASEASGAPYLMHHASGQARRLPHSVSLSHTPAMAVAVVAIGAAPPALPAMPAAAPVATMPDAPRPSRRLAALNFLLVMAALAASGLALYRTYANR